MLLCTYGHSTTTLIKHRLRVEGNRHMRRGASRLNESSEPSEPSTYKMILSGLLLAAGASSVFKRDMVHAEIFPSTSETSARLAKIARKKNYSADTLDIAFPACDIGTLGGLTQNVLALKYSGNNATMALAMASAGITIRLILNLAIICIIHNWLNDSK